VLAAIDSDFIPAATLADSSSAAGLAYFIEADERSRRYTAYIGSERLTATSELQHLLDTVQAHAHHNVAETAVENLFLHAGAVAWRGRGILFPGRSHSGKSTLVRALVAAGASYLSDEFAVLDENGLVHPFARPIWLRTETGRISYHASELGGRTATQALPVSAVLFTTFSPRETFRPECLTPGCAILEVLKHVVAVRANPQRAIQMARAVTAKSLVIRSPRGNASSAATEILNILNRSSAPNLFGFAEGGGDSCTHSPEQQI
jgi:hypothetical protein